MGGTAVTGGELVALVLIVALTAAALVAILWLAGQPVTVKRPTHRCDNLLPPFAGGPSYLCEKPAGHPNAHRCGETTWSRP